MTKQGECPHDALPGLSFRESQDKCAFSGLPTASHAGPLTLLEIPMERAPPAFSVTSAVDLRWRSEHFASAQSWLWGSVEDSCPVHPGPGPREQRQGRGGPPTNGVARAEPVSVPQRPPGRHGVTSALSRSRPPPLRPLPRRFRRALPLRGVVPEQRPLRVESSLGLQPWAHAGTPGTSGFEGRVPDCGRGVW